MKSHPKKWHVLTLDVDSRGDSSYVFTACCFTKIKLFVCRRRAGARWATRWRRSRCMTRTWTPGPSPSGSSEAATSPAPASWGSCTTTGITAGTTGPGKLPRCRGGSASRSSIRTVRSGARKCSCCVLNWPHLMMVWNYLIKVVNPSLDSQTYFVRQQKYLLKIFPTSAAARRQRNKTWRRSTCYKSPPSSARRNEHRVLGPGGWYRHKFIIISKNL